MKLSRGFIFSFKRVRSIMFSNMRSFHSIIQHLFITRSFYCNTSILDEIKNLSGAPQNLKTLLDNAAAFEDKNPPSDVWTSPVYPVLTKRSQAQHSIRPQVDPTKTSIVLFPGQGVQHVTMAKDLIEYPNVRDMFGTASDILKYNLFDLCVNGPKDMLDMTAHCQVAVMVASLAAVEKLRKVSPEMIERCVATAGFSVGEYAALVFAGALEFEDAVRLLNIRGKAMQAASELRSSGMMTVFLKPSARIKSACASAREWCANQGMEDAVCNVGIYLFPECKVISGDMEALKFLELNAADFGIKKIKYIRVSGAFHSKCMEPAKAVLCKALKSVPLETPLIAVHSNCDGKPYSNTDKIREKLAKQLISPVVWEQTMHIIFERTHGTAFPNTIECGPGRSLKTILKYNNAKAYENCSNIFA